MYGNPVEAPFLSKSQYYANDDLVNADAYQRQIEREYYESNAVYLNNNGITITGRDNILSIWQSYLGIQGTLLNELKVKYRNQYSYNQAALNLQEQIYDFNNPNAPNSLYSDASRKINISVGQPGFVEGLLPGWGSGRALVDDLQNNRQGSAVFNAGLFISDLFFIRSVAIGIGKGGLKMLGKSYVYWSSARRFYGREGFAEAGQQLHHWAWARNGATKGEGVAWWAKNQMWNLMPMADKGLHQSIHGVGATPFGPLRQFYYGTPTWFKSVIISLGGRIE